MYFIYSRFYTILSTMAQKGHWFARTIIIPARDFKFPHTILEYTHAILNSPSNCKNKIGLVGSKATPRSSNYKSYPPIQLNKPRSNLLYQGSSQNWCRLDFCERSVTPFLPSVLQTRNRIIGWCSPQLQGSNRNFSPYYGSMAQISAQIIGFL